MPNDQPVIRRSILPRAIFCTFAIVLAYILSYPPLLQSSMYARLKPLYQPVEWLLIHSPLQKPLLLWGRLTGSERYLRMLVEFHLLRERIEKNRQMKEALDSQVQTIVCSWSIEELESLRLTTESDSTLTSEPCSPLRCRPLQTNDRDDQQCCEQGAGEGDRLAEEDDAEHEGSHRADADPDAVGGADWDVAGRE